VRARDRQERDARDNCPTPHVQNDFILHGCPHFVTLNVILGNFLQFVNYFRFFNSTPCSQISDTPTDNTLTQPFYGSVDFVWDNRGEPVTEETITHSHSSWSSIIPICFLHLLQSMASSLFNQRVLQSFSTISLQVFLLAWHPPLHTPYISSSNHYLLFATHAHTIATCFAVVPKLCHLNLVSLSTLYSELYFVTSHHTFILPFSSLTSEVPPHFPFLQARSHFHATYCFTHNYWTISLSLSSEKIIKIS